MRPRARPWWRYSVRLDPALGSYSVYATGPREHGPSWYIPLGLDLPSAYLVAECVAKSQVRCDAANWHPVSPW